MSKKRLFAGNKSDTTSKDDNSGDPTEIEKQELRMQIKKLKALISHVEDSLDITKFGNIEESSKILLSQTVDYRTSKKLVDTNVLFRQEIQRYAGIYCSKATKMEYILHYEPHNETDKKENFSLQILNKGGKGTLGHWVTPMLSIDIDKILTETPIDDVSMIIPFLKNWRRHIDCYVQRKKQFQELKDSFCDTTNFSMDSNLNFSGITLLLFGIHNRAKDSYFDMTIYLAYKPNETRPYKINTEWSLKKCSLEDENELKAYTKCLKNHRLIEGFKLMIESKHPIFWWTTEKHDDSPLELNNTSDSDEESFMDRIKSNRKKSLRKLRKHRESKERSKRMRGKRKSGVLRSKIVRGKQNEDSSNEARSSPEETKKPSESPSRLRKRKEPENTIEELIAKRHRVLRQTTISFRDKKITTDRSTIAEVRKVPDSNDKKSVKPNYRKVVGKTVAKTPPVKKMSPVGILSAKKRTTGKMNRAVTSTPLAKKIANKVKFSPINNVELSPIVSAVESNNAS